MKLTLSWLKEYLDTNASGEEICESLTKIGLEVEEVEDKAKSLEKFKVAQIIEACPVENSKKLQICKVKTENEDSLQVICGAKNARSGLKIAFAPIGSTIPSNKMVIKKAKLAGLESNGMICSGQELNISEDSEGIIEIDDKFAIGTPISEVFGLNEAVIEINVTPNRGDCLGIYGIARDLAAAGIGKLKDLNIKDEAGEFAFPIKASNEAKESAGKSAFCVIKNVKNQESPLWLKEKLESIGQNSISAIVDITNYVMFCLNRPMHAYDFNKIDGEIKIRFAKNKEKFTSLKEIDYELDEKILTIADSKKLVGIAGVMGSLNSTCDIDTTDILLESAYFSPEATSHSGKTLNILSDARYRFERGIDDESCIDGINLAKKLILEICGGTPSETEIISEAKAKTVINFDISKIKKTTDINVTQQEVDEILTKLGCKINGQNVEIPSHRSDLSTNQDLVEEIVRIHGYDKIIAKIPNGFSFDDIKISENLEFKLNEKARHNLKNSGFVETINWSFIDKNLLSKFGLQEDETLEIANPISIEMNYMRPNLIIGLLNSYKKNYLRNFSNLSLFEIGNIFNKQDSQELMISGIRAGKNKESDHYQDQRDFDVFDVKNDVFKIVKEYGLNPDNLQISNDSPLKYYHPHRFACLKLGKNIIGYFGEIHPKITKNYDIKNRINIFEIFIDKLPKKIKSKNNKAFTINDLPIVERDFAFLINRQEKVGDLVNIILKIDKQLIKEVSIFDIYQGKNIEENKKSVALRVKMQPTTKTLTSSEIEEISQKIISKIQENFQATLREA